MRLRADQLFWPTPFSFWLKVTEPWEPMLNVCQSMIALDWLWLITRAPPALLVASTVAPLSLPPLFKVGTSVGDTALRELLEAAADSAGDRTVWQTRPTAQVLLTRESGFFVRFRAIAPFPS